jgi:hypothetical protein
MTKHNTPGISGKVSAQPRLHQTAAEIQAYGTVSFLLPLELEEPVRLEMTSFWAPPIFIPKRPLSSHPLAFFFPCRLAFPSPTADLCVFPRSPVLHRTQCISDRSTLYVSDWGRMA